MSAQTFGLRGSVTAMATPFRDGRIDHPRIAALCDRQIGRGTAALVMCGSTGEAGSLRRTEFAAVIRLAVAAAAGRVPILAGCGALSTEGSAALARLAAENGAAALLCAPPPYCKPTQAGILAHLRVLHERAPLPVLLYDVPSRTGIAIGDETVARAYEQGLVFGVKDATGDLARPPRLRALCGGGLTQMSGDDATAAAHLAMGGHGCVSVLSNLLPATCALLHEAWRGGDLATFARTRDHLAPVAEALFVESNPIPLKVGMERLGLSSAEIRLPLTPATEPTLALLSEVLSTASSMEEALAVRSRYALVS